MRVWLIVAAWVVAAAWTAKLVSVWRGLRGVDDLLAPQFDQMPEETPSLAVIVPARNEAADIARSLRALAAQDYPNVQIIAVNDRSTDETGQLMREVEAEAPDRVRVIEIEDLPAGWLGKTHAMAVAAAATKAEFLLFTDADVQFRPDALRRAMCAVVRDRADHFVALPTTIIHRWDEAAMLGFFQIMGMWAVRLWEVPNPDVRDAVGVGAFNLVRRTAYEQVGGFASLRMEIIEDLGIARRLKQAGFRSRAAFGRGLVSLHWASGAGGIVNVMTKNMFSAFRFHTVLLLLACGWLVLIAILPFAGFFWWGTLLPGLVTLAAVAGLLGQVEKHSGLSAWNALMTPVAAAAFIYAMIKSMTITLAQGGVRWRGTFYPLEELRRMSAPLPKLWGKSAIGDDR